MKRTERDILRVIEEATAISAKAIFEALNSQDRATIYRNLGALVEKGRIRKITGKGMAKLYEINDSDHMHMICDQCGKIYHLKPSEKLVDEVKRLIKDFADGDVEVIIKAKCK